MGARAPLVCASQSLKTVQNSHGAPHCGAPQRPLRGRTTPQQAPLFLFRLVTRCAPRPCGFHTGRGWSGGALFLFLPVVRFFMFGFVKRGGAAVAGGGAVARSSFLVLYSSLFCPAFFSFFPSLSLFLGLLFRLVFGIIYLWLSSLLLPLSAPGLALSLLPSRVALVLPGFFVARVAGRSLPRSRSKCRRTAPISRVPSRSPARGVFRVCRSLSVPSAVACSCGCAAPGRCFALSRSGGCGPSGRTCFFSRRPRRGGGLAPRVAVVGCCRAGGRGVGSRGSYRVRARRRSVRPVGRAGVAPRRGVCFSAGVRGSAASSRVSGAYSLGRVGCRVSRGVPGFVWRARSWHRLSGFYCGRFGPAGVRRWPRSAYRVGLVGGVARWGVGLGFFL